MDHPVDRQEDHPVGRQEDHPVDGLMDRQVEPVGCSMAVAVQGRPQAIPPHQRLRGPEDFWMVVELIGRVGSSRST
jgi:hypothetical protein